MKANETEYEVQVVYMLPDRIRSLGLLTHSEHLLVNVSAADIKGMDFDYASKTLFWIESKKGVIMSKQVNFDGSPGGPVKTLRKDLIQPIHLSWDWIGKNFYFFSNGYIAACNENGTFCTNVIPTGYTMISSLVVVPEEGILFYSIWSNSPNNYGQIERSDMNGADKKKKRIVFNDGRIKWPNGLTVDTVLKRLYWADTFLGQVGMCDYEGRHRQILLTYSLAHPYGLALFEDNLYVANMGSDTMIRCSKFNGRARVIVHRRNVKTELMKVFHEVLQTKKDNPCEGNTCEQLCLLRPNGSSCSCTSGFSLSSNNTCVPDSDMTGFADSNSIFSAPGTSCNENLCQNGAECRSVGSMSFKCICLPGFTGLHCEFSPHLESAIHLHSVPDNAFVVTLAVLAIIAAVLVIAVVVNYYMEGPVTMNHLIGRQNPLKNISISFRNPMFHSRGTTRSPLIEGEEKVDYLEEETEIAHGSSMDLNGNSGASFTLKRSLVSNPAFHCEDDEPATLELPSGSCSSSGFNDTAHLIP